MDDQNVPVTPTDDQPTVETPTEETPAEETPAEETHTCAPDCECDTEKTA